jgi:hypothetical protein
MRFVGLTLCLLVSSLGARAESIEDRMAALERQVKTLEEALRNQSGQQTITVTDAADAEEKTARPTSDTLPISPQLAASELTLTGS